MTGQGLAFPSIKLTQSNETPLKFSSLDVSLACKIQGKPQKLRAIGNHKLLTTIFRPPRVSGPKVRRRCSRRRPCLRKSLRHKDLGFVRRRGFARVQRGRLLVASEGGQLSLTACVERRALISRGRNLALRHSKLT